MESKLTPKEQASRERYAINLKKLVDNEHQCVGIYVEGHAENSPQKMALLFEDKSWTWSEFNRESNKFANLFINLGLKPGETIALIMENSPEYLFITTGINKIQGITALVNINQKGQALIHSIKIVEPKFIVIDEPCLPNLEEVLGELKFEKDKIFIVKNSGEINDGYVNLRKEMKKVSDKNPNTTQNSKMTDLGLYIYTSGTTGLPKAVIMLNNALPFNGAYYGASITQADSSDVVYVTNPLYHSLSMCTAWGIASYMGATVALRRKFSASNFWKDVQKFKVTFTTYVGEIPRYILNQPESEEEKNHTLKKMLGLGLKKIIWNKFKERFHIDHIFEYYSSTEGYGPIVNVDEKPGMIGRNIIENHVLAKVDGESGEFYKDGNGFYIKCSPGDIGMSITKILDVDNFSKYRNKEKTFQRIIRDVFEKDDAYFVTGDLLQLHDDLWLSFADRFGDTYRWKGENVSTQEIENILNTHDSILLSAVYGVEIPNHEGKAGMAAIKFKKEFGFDSEEISRFFTKVLPKYSIPIFIRVREELEITGSNKIRKSNLRKEAFNIDTIDEPIYFWDSSAKRYLELDNSTYKNIFEGKKEF